MSKSEKVLLSQEQTNQLVISELGKLAREPMVQALLVYMAVEFLQSQKLFGSTAGTVLEGTVLVKAIDFSQAMANIAKVSEAVAPLIKLAAVAGG